MGSAWRKSQGPEENALEKDTIQREEGNYPQEAAKYTSVINARKLCRCQNQACHLSIDSTPRNEGTHLSLKEVWRDHICVCHAYADNVPQERQSRQRL